MPSFNQVILIGHVGGDPTLKEFDNFKVVSFSLATNQNRKSKTGDGSWEKIPSWHNIQITKQSTAEYCLNFIKKGDAVQVVGNLLTEVFEKDGLKSYFTKVIVQNNSHLLQKLSKSEIIEDSFKGEDIEIKQETIDDEIPF